MTVHYSKKSIVADLDIIDASPSLDLKDSDCADADINAQLACNATTTTSGAEDIDVTLKQQVNGTLTTFLTADADGDIALGASGQATKGLLMGDTTLMVGSGCLYSTIGAAMTAASAGDTILVMPGTYTETVTFGASNIQVVGLGSYHNVIIQQANANVIDANTRDGCEVTNCTIKVTAATTAINTVQVSTGYLHLLDCEVMMTSSQALVQASQPAVGACSGTGKLILERCELKYAHTGVCGGTAIKSAVTVGTGGEVELHYCDDCTIVNTGTALTSSVCADLSTTGIARVHDCDWTISDPNCTILAGLGYIGGTGTAHEFFRNEVAVTATANAGYGLYAADAASTTRSFFNHIKVEDTGGTSYTFFVGASATVISHFDDLVSDDGLSGTGTFTQVSSESDGDLEVTGLITNLTGIDLEGRLEVPRTAITASANSAATSLYFGCDSVAADTITFQSTDIAMAGRIFIVKDEGGSASTNNITLATQGAETIDGDASVKIVSDYGCLWLISDGSNLFVI